MPTTGVRSTESSAIQAAQRWILGTLLLEPTRWHDVQTRVRTEDFSDPDLRRLAEIYWAHQRDEGEPVFNQFLSSLEEPGLKELAVSLLSEVDEQEQVNRDQGLSESIDALLWARSDTERWARQAALGEKASDEVEELRRLTELTRAASKRNQNV
jgi:hypothetical protein